MKPGLLGRHFIKGSPPRGHWKAAAGEPGKKGDEKPRGDRGRRVKLQRTPRGAGPQPPSASREGSALAWLQTARSGPSGAAAASARSCLPGHRGCSEEGPGAAGCRAGHGAHLSAALVSQELPSPQLPCTEVENRTNRNHVNCCTVAPNSAERLTYFAFETRC